MPPRKIAVRPPNAKNNGKSSNGKYLDDHPEFQTGYWKNHVAEKNIRKGLTCLFGKGHFLRLDYTTK